MLLRRHVLGILIVIKCYYAINYVEIKFPLIGGPLGQAKLPRSKIRKCMTKAIRQENGKFQKL